MAMKTLSPGGQRLPRTLQHSVRFTTDAMPKYKPYGWCQETPQSSLVSYSSSADAGETSTSSPESIAYQPASHRYAVNEQRIKLLIAINQIVQQRAELETSRAALSALLDELKKKLRRKVDESHAEKKDKMKALKQTNLKLEKEKFSIICEIEHLKRHLEKEEMHHKQHARNAVAQAIQGVARGTSDHLFSPCSVSDLPSMVCRSVAKNAPSKIADNKLAAARLMRDIAELRQRVAQVEARLANELKRKRQAEIDIMRLRKELSSTKSNVASLRLPPPLLRGQCSKFA